MQPNEAMRLIANLIKEGVIEAVDPKGFVRVRHGGILSDWLGYFVPAAGGVSVHRPPSIGERCIMLSPSGETANAVVLCGLASAAHPSPSASAEETVVVFPDGARIEYHHSSGFMNISGIQSGKVQAAQSLTFDTPQSTFTGQVTAQGLFTYQAGMSGTGGGAGTVIQGAINHNGTLTNTGKISSNGVLLDEHKHTGVLAGGERTGAPEK